jgi:hypothetical protein
MKHGKRYYVGDGDVEYVSKKAAIAAAKVMYSKTGSPVDICTLYKGMWILVAVVTNRVNTNI